MNHKLRVLVRVDADPALVTVEVGGCLTQADFPALTHIIRRAARIRAESAVSIDLHGASHLDPEVLLQLRTLAGPGTGPDGTGPFRMTLREPADLPICLLHVGADGEVLAGLEGGQLNSGVDRACNPTPEELNTVNGTELREFFEGTLDPAATVRALSDAALGQLADALYRHLDTSSPSFGAHTWYELAAEELQNRHRTDAGGHADGELAAGQALA
jgi:hypothetical protein